MESEQTTPRGLNKGHGSKFRVGSRVQQETLEEGRRIYRPKRCEYNKKDNSQKTLNDKNHQPSSQKLRQLNSNSVGSCHFQIIYWWLGRNFNRVLTSDNEAPVLEIYTMWNIPSLPLLLGTLWPEVVVPVSISSLGQINQFENYLYF